MHIIKFPDVLADLPYELPVKGMELSIQESLARVQMLIIERTSHYSRAALTRYFFTQAFVSSTSTQLVPERADIYVSLFGHPDQPARCVSRGVNSFMADLADGTYQQFRDVQVIALDGPEHMMTVMPFRLKRFIECCACRHQSVVVLTSAAQRVIDTTMTGLSVDIETINVERLIEKIPG